MTPEGRVKEKIKKLLDSYMPLWYFMPVSGGFGKQGIPDFIICANGTFVVVEAKAEDGHVTSLQQLQLSGVQAANGFPIVVKDAVTLDVLEMHLRFRGCVPKQQ